MIGGTGRTSFIASNDNPTFAQRRAARRVCCAWRFKPAFFPTSPAPCKVVRRPQSPAVSAPAVIATSRSLSRPFISFLFSGKWKEKKMKMKQEKKTGHPSFDLLFPKLALGTRGKKEAVSPRTGNGEQENEPTVQQESDGWADHADIGHNFGNERENSRF